MHVVQRTHNPDEDLPDGESGLSGSHEIYDQFYRTYGAERFIDPVDLRPVLPLPVVDGRVLHFDNREVARATHLIVRQKRGILRSAHGQHIEGGKEYSYLTYPENTFVVATTDGQSITRWIVSSAHGIMDELVDGVTPYNPSITTFHLEIVNDQNEQATLIYNSKEGNGTMRFGDEIGWILSDADSTVEKHVALQSIPDNIGHAAIELASAA